MLINLTELPLMNWSDAQILAAQRLTADGVLREYELPTITPQDATIRVRDTGWETEHKIYEAFSPIDAIIVQGEPIFVDAFVGACKSEIPPIACYSPCYDSNGNFVQFRRF